MEALTLLPHPLPVWAYPSGRLVALAILGGLLLDLAYPRHEGLLLRLHPVHTSFRLAQKLVRPGVGRLGGLLYWLAVVSLHLAAYSLLLYLSWRVSPVAWLLAASWTVKVSLSLRLLLETVWEAGRRAGRGDWPAARRLVQGIVRRNVYTLGGGHVLSAAVESLAESLVDGYTSPLLYTALLGPLGGLLQRLANTLDSALGYRHDWRREAGWASAVIDTLLNYVPARLTALAILATEPRRLPRLLGCWLRHRGGTGSVNAGNPMAAMACVLGVRLEKPGYYSLGEPWWPLPSSGDVARAVGRALLAALLYTVPLLLALLTA